MRCRLPIVPTTLALLALAWSGLCAADITASVPAPQPTKPHMTFEATHHDVPEGATALCNDRSYSFKKTPKPCAGHMGVDRWLK
ncbi:DUF3761 domain-containing protein [Andreprevotia chitinilytica]|uniref:DUF3761 domain-containing protein n=1 Tax=Andreprevotia chitinilytica TaxID=396808 RepID=UPI000A03985B|nr:DUF3761 domain-containing protein [Andreprevotia chitinilytica]